MMSRRVDTLQLLELCRWLRRVLEALHSDTQDPQTRATLHAVIRALDPETNPRLAPIVKRHEGRSSE